MIFSSGLKLSLITLIELAYFYIDFIFWEVILLSIRISKHLNYLTDYLENLEVWLPVFFAQILEENPVAFRVWVALLNIDVANLLFDVTFERDFWILIWNFDVNLILISVIITSLGSKYHESDRLNELEIFC